MKPLRINWLLLLCLWLPAADAHHVLGRPSYSLNEDSNTPPSMQMETQIGDYFVNYMVYPAFPRPGETGRINLYVNRLDGSAPFAGKISFRVRDAGWFSRHEESIGEQWPDDNVFRQGFVFTQEGDYIITAAFEADGQPYQIDFPLRIGQRSAVGPLGITAALLVSVLVMVSLIQRRKLTRGKIRAVREERAQ